MFQALWMGMSVSVIIVNEWAQVFQLNFLKTVSRPNLAHLSTSVLDTDSWNSQSVEEAGMVVNQKIIGIQHRSGTSTNHFLNCEELYWLGENSETHNQASWGEGFNHSPSIKITRIVLLYGSCVKSEVRQIEKFALF